MFCNKQFRTRQTFHGSEGREMARRQKKIIMTLQKVEVTLLLCSDMDNTTKRRRILNIKYKIHSKLFRHNKERY
jgi:thiamine kinase-like enzyme